MYVARAATLFTKEAETTAPEITYIMLTYISDPSLRLQTDHMRFYLSYCLSSQRIIYSEMKHTIMTIGECISKIYILHESVLL